MVFNATFNNISVISWQTVLLVEETRVHEENHWQILLYNVVSSMCLAMLVVIDTDCIGTCTAVVPNPTTIIYDHDHDGI